MSFKLFLGLGTAILVLLTLYTGAKYDLTIWKRILLALAGVVVGVIGTVIMFYIETGKFDGRSFFGAVFFSPLLLIPIGLVMKIKPSETLDLYAPAECAMSVLMKINCYISRCCVGRVLYVTEFGKKIRFPSQICEAAAALLILVFLLVCIIRKKGRGSLYYLYMVVYGTLRFILNLLRETTPFVLNLPAGNFWALIAIIVGGGILLIKHFRDSKTNLHFKEGKNYA